MYSWCHQFLGKRVILFPFATVYYLTKINLTNLPSMSSYITRIFSRFPSPLSTILTAFFFLQFHFHGWANSRIPIMCPIIFCFGLKYQLAELVQAGMHPSKCVDSNIWCLCYRVFIHGAVWMLNLPQIYIWGQYWLVDIYLTVKMHFLCGFNDFTWQNFHVFIPSTGLCFYKGIMELNHLCYVGFFSELSEA